MPDGEVKCTTILHIIESARIAFAARIHEVLKLLSSAAFFSFFFSKINLFEKFIGDHQCQTVWIQIRHDKMSGLIWVQTVCKPFTDDTRRQRWAGLYVMLYILLKI